MHINLSLVCVNIEINRKLKQSKSTSLMSFKSNNQNKIRYKQINKSLTINNEWQYLAIRDG